MVWIGYAIKQVGRFRSVRRKALEETEEGERSLGVVLWLLLLES